MAPGRCDAIDSSIESGAEQLAFFCSDIASFSVRSLLEDDATNTGNVDELPKVHKGLYESRHRASTAATPDLAVRAGDNWLCSATRAKQNRLARQQTLDSQILPARGSHSSASGSGSNHHHNQKRASESHGSDNNNNDTFALMRSLMALAAQQQQQKQQQQQQEKEQCNDSSDSSCAPTQHTGSFCVGATMPNPPSQYMQQQQQQQPQVQPALPWCHQPEMVGAASLSQMLNSLIAINSLGVALDGHAHHPAAPQMMNYREGGEQFLPHDSHPQYSSLNNPSQQMSEMHSSKCARHGSVSSVSRTSFSGSSSSFSTDFSASSSVDALLTAMHHNSNNNNNNNNITYENSGIFNGNNTPTAALMRVESGLHSLDSTPLMMSPTESCNLQLQQDRPGAELMGSNSDFQATLAALSILEQQLYGENAAMDLSTLHANDISTPVASAENNNSRVMSAPHQFQHQHQQHQALLEASLTATPPLTPSTSQLSPSLMDEASFLSDMAGESASQPASFSDLTSSTHVVADSISAGTASTVPSACPMDLLSPSSAVLLASPPSDPLFNSTDNYGAGSCSMYGGQFSARCDPPLVGSMWSPPGTPSLTAASTASRDSFSSYGSVETTDSLLDLEFVQELGFSVPVNEREVYVVSGLANELHTIVAHM